MELQHDWVDNKYIAYTNSASKNKLKVKVVKHPLGPAYLAKKAGLKNVNEMMELTGVSRSTLSDWKKNRPKLFEIILAGCVAKKKELENQEQDKKESM